MKIQETEKIERQAEMVCREFEIFCDYVLQDTVKPAKRTENIGRKDCFELNSCLRVQENYEKPTRVQADYPIINFFYYSARRYRILEMNDRGTKFQKGENYEAFQAASAVEKYVFFLVILMSDQRFLEHEIGFMFQISGFIEWAEDAKLLPGEIYELPHQIFRGYVGMKPLKSLSFLEELGVFEVKETVQHSDRNKIMHWKVKMGSLFPVCHIVYKELGNQGLIGDADALPVFFLESCMEKRFPEYATGNIKKILEEKERDYSGKTVELEISVRYEDCLRIVCLNLSDSLYALHLMIQKVFEFDDDHLFEFYVGNGMFRDTFTTEEAVTSGDEFSAEETMLGDLGLKKGAKFSYLFDFGDMWWFDIKVLEIAEDYLDSPKLVKAVKPAPKQYPDWEC